jgi:hypothetical protein
MTSALSETPLNFKDIVAAASAMPETLLMPYLT